MVNAQTARQLRFSTSAPDDRLDRFARAMALRDRSAHRRWLSDAVLESALRGYAYAAAMAEHSLTAPSSDDVAHAIATYRRARRLPPPAGDMSRERTATQLRIV